MFTGEYRFLSNFYSVQVEYEHEWYPSVEHAYQAAKTERLPERRQIQAAPTPNAAKRLGQRVHCRTDWPDRRLGVMNALLRQKFAPGTPLALALIQTGDALLVEGNWWGDRFWGVCDGVGENHLGFLLMEIREALQ